MIKNQLINLSLRNTDLASFEYVTAIKLPANIKSFDNISVNSEPCKFIGYLQKETNAHYYVVNFRYIDNKPIAYGVKIPKRCVTKIEKVMKFIKVIY